MNIQSHNLANIPNIEYKQQERKRYSVSRCNRLLSKYSLMQNEQNEMVNKLLTHPINVMQLGVQCDGIKNYCRAITKRAIIYEYALASYEIHDRHQR
jgi:hypothetical protein